MKEKLLLFFVVVSFCVQSQAKFKKTKFLDVCVSQDEWDSYDVKLIYDKVFFEVVSKDIVRLRHTGIELQGSFPRELKCITHFKAQSLETTEISCWHPFVAFTAKYNAEKRYAVGKFVGSDAATQVICNHGFLE